MAVVGAGLIVCATLLSRHTFPELAWLWWLILLVLGLIGPLVIRWRHRRSGPTSD